ncbi:MAG: MBOAT family protein [Bacteroidetes bacterium]|nr:MAG: MBOAT family protein [Bacteroidota bacterium]
MVFSSAIFILYFLPVFLLVYHLVGAKYKNWVILLFSIVFYAWGAPTFIFYLLGATTANFYIVRAMDKSNEKLHRKLWLALSISINLGLLIYFKYANFFVDNINAVLSVFHFNTFTLAKILLPIGISFYTFQSITYTLDVYRKVHKPLDKLHNFVLYIIMFPQMIAGPIVRFITIADEIQNRKEKIEEKLEGLIRFVIGLSKKVLIADVLAYQVDKIMLMDYATMDSTTAWIGILGFTFQIYFDFSGYSDMAIGLGKMMGFHFPENFNNPYIARSVTEFWRRWHITFSTFMRNYLYYPLGGSRVKTKRRLYFNLWFVFLVSGLWHGSSWNFVIYGAFHGFIMVIERVFLLNILERIPKVFSILFTFFVIVLARVFFRVETLPDAMVYFERLFAFDFTSVSFAAKPHFYTIMIFSAILSFITATRFGLKIEAVIYKTNLSIKQYYVYTAIAFLFLVYSIASVAGSGFSPFIYFRF